MGFSGAWHVCGPQPPGPVQFPARQTLGLLTLKPCGTDTQQLDTPAKPSSGFWEEERERPWVLTPLLGTALTH